MSRGPHFSQKRTVKAKKISLRGPNDHLKKACQTGGPIACPMRPNFFYAKIHLKLLLYIEIIVKMAVYCLKNVFVKENKS